MHALVSGATRPATASISASRPSPVSAEIAQRLGLAAFTRSQAAGLSRSHLLNTSSTGTADAPTSSSAHASDGRNVTLGSALAASM